MRQTVAIAKKEISSAFGSPLALIFIGTFLLVTLFVFFWVATFFARGIADVRPMFTWMPLLLVFLVAALTMRQWSEEQRSGTLEMLMTLPIGTWRLVLGKFLAVMTLVLVALVLTLGLPITVALLGNLDWGPVVGGYVAALLMASAYAAIGLFVSSRSDNQIVSLIVTLLIGGLFYVIGTPALLDFVPSPVGGVLRELSTTTHFASIERGVLDIRDLIFYLSLAGLFLSLNALSLDSKRWSRGDLTRPYRTSRVVGIGLVALNLVLLNAWILPLVGLRLDITQGHAYTLSSTTEDLLHSLQEPLLIRAYMSKKTHPLLEPLLPQVADMLREYQAASGGRVKAEVVDPATDQQVENEANQAYGITPHPFQVASRYESSVVNAYFDVLVRYGDQSQVLKLSDLISVTPSPTGGQPDVQLDNLEYNLTRAVKKVVAGFSDVDSVLASLDSPAKLTLLSTPATLPSDLKDAAATVQKVANDLASGANGKLTFAQVNPRAKDATLTPDVLAKQYGVRPIPVSLMSPDTYYFQMLLTVGGQTQLVVPQGDLSEASVKDAVTSGLKRAASGFLKVVGVWTPPQNAQPNMFGQQQPQIYKTQLIQQQLQRDYQVEPVTLDSGSVPNDVDTLLVLSPQGMSDKQRFAIDQFLMRGGSVVVAGGDYALTTDPYAGSLALKKIDGGLADMLKSYGVTVGDQVVLDTQDSQFPVVVPRSVNGVPVREVQAVDYPFFVDVRPGEMADASPITSSLPQVTVPWASPVSVDASDARDVKVLLRSSPGAWTSQDTNIVPDFQAHPQYGFAVGGTQKSYPLAVAVRGTFSSFFKDKANPLQADAAASGGQNGADANAGGANAGGANAGGSNAGASNAAGANASGANAAGPNGNGAGSSDASQAGQIGVLTSSPDGARLVVIGSGEVVNDTVLNLASQLGQDRSAENLQLVQNAVDWSVEDADLLDIRASGAKTRVLEHLTASEETDWEVGNYAFALVALLLLAVLWQWRRRSRAPMIATAGSAATDRAAKGGRG